MAGQQTYPDPAKLVQALRVIRTWAAFDSEEPQRTALLPGDVVKLCDKALAEWPGDCDEL
jgi:hypothetical protein